jgi:hypothetical protein
MKKFVKKIQNLSITFIIYLKVINTNNFKMRTNLIVK